MRRPAEFRRNQRFGRRVTSEHFVFIVSPSPEPGPCRLGLVASRKVGNALARNRVKRLVRESFRQLRVELPADVDIVVVVRQPTGDAKLSAIIAEWRGAAKSLRRRAAELRDRPPAPNAVPPPAGPAASATKPAASATKPVASANKPVASATKPAASATKPAASATKRSTHDGRRR